MTGELFPERTPLEVLTDPRPNENPVVAIYGNGLASVVALGALDALQDEKLLRNVKGYSAESGGAYDATAAELGQISMALELFTEVLPRDNLVSPMNLMSKSPALLDLKKLTSRLRTTHKLDIGSITNEPEILVGLSRISDAQPTTVRLGDVPAERRLEVLERSASIPLAAGKTKLSTCDGAVLSPSPALAAAKAGYTHILLLANTPTEAPPWTESAVHRFVARRMHKKYGNPGVELEEAMSEYTKLFKQHSEDLRAGRIGSTVVQVVRPEKADGLPSCYSTGKKLHRGVQAGRNAMLNALGQPDRIRPLPDYERQLFAAASVASIIKKKFAGTQRPESEPKEALHTPQPAY